MKLKLFFSSILFFAFAITATAQSGRIEGTITTERNRVLANVNVELLGSSLGTSTDANGTFILRNVTNGEYDLQITYLGYKTRIIPVSITGQVLNLGKISLTASEQELDAVTLTGKNANKFTRKESTTAAKMPLLKMENPQVYNVITAELLQDQVVTSFDDALKNTPGIDKLWESTGRGGDGAGYFALRGFAVQPTLVNGFPSLTNGSPDPANIDNIEVLKGPSGTLYGSSLISYGGLINVNTKRPFYGFGGNVSYTVGSYGLHRVTADINTMLSKTEDIAMRVNAAYHTQNSYQDAGFRKSLFVAPSLSYRVNDKLSFFVNTEFYIGKSTNQTMLFLDRGVPLRVINIDELGYDHKRSYTGNDLYLNTPTFNLQAMMEYKLSDAWTSQTVFSSSTSKSDGYYSYLYETTQFTPVTEGIVLSRFISKQNSETVGTDIQQNFIGDFKLGSMRNRVVAGLDFYATRRINNSTGYVGNGQIYIGDNLQQFNEQVLGIDDPAAYTDDSGVLTQPGTDALLTGSQISPSEIEQKIYSAYVSDVLNILPELNVMASLRIDHFVNNDYDQTALSPKFGVVYQPVMDKVSVFANYMNGFSNVPPVLLEDNTFRSFDPEKANQFEVGTKLNLFNRLSATLSYYDIQVSNTVIQVAPNEFSQGGERYSKGFEVSFTANPIDGLNIIAGYSYNDSELTTAAEGDDFAGRRPESAGPQDLANLWASYRFNQGALDGFGLGFGGNYASENKIFNRNLGGTFTLPEYTILNASAFYDYKDFRITLKLDNIANKEYYKGWSTISPQQLRSLSANLTYSF